MGWEFKDFTTTSYCTVCGAGVDVFAPSLPAAEQRRMIREMQERHDREVHGLHDQGPQPRPESLK